MPICRLWSHLLNLGHQQLLRGTRYSIDLLLHILAPCLHERSKGKPRPWTCCLSTPVLQGRQPRAMPRPCCDLHHIMIQASIIHTVAVCDEYLPQLSCDENRMCHAARASRPSPAWFRGHTRAWGLQNGLGDAISVAETCAFARYCLPNSSAVPTLVTAKVIEQNTGISTNAAPLSVQTQQETIRRTPWPPVVHPPRAAQFHVNRACLAGTGIQRLRRTTLLASWRASADTAVFQTPYSSM